MNYLSVNLKFISINFSYNIFSYIADRSQGLTLSAIGLIAACVLKTKMKRNVNLHTIGIEQNV